MKSSTRRSIWRAVAAAVVLAFVAMTMDAQGTIKNSGIWNNTSGSTVTTTNFTNYKVATPGTVNNGGTLTVNSTLDNNLAGATITNVNTSAGTIDLSGATTSYNNGAGTTTNGTSTASVIKIGNTMTLSGTSFSTTQGTVEYVKVGNQTIYAANIASGTYGALALRNGTTANAKTVEGTGTTLTVAGALTLDADKLVVGTNNTLKIGGAGVTTNGTVAFDATTGGGTTVEYTANSAQAVFPTNYVNLTMSGSSGSNSKTAAGNVGISGTLAVSANDIFDVTGGNSLSFTGASFQVNNLGNIRASGNVSFASVITPTAAGSWEYYGTALQTVGAFAYTNLTLSSASGNKQFQSGTSSVSGSYSVTTTGTIDYRTNSTTFNYAGTGQTLYAHDYYNLGLTGTGSFALSTAGLSARTVTVASGATMALSGAGTAQVGYTANNGTMTVNGGLTLASGTTLTLGTSGGPFYGTFTNNGTGMSNSGTINLYGDGTASFLFTNASGATLANTSTGSIGVHSADLDNDGGTITNDGAITVN